MTKNDIIKLVEELNNFDNNPDRVAWLKYQWLNVLKDADCLTDYLGGKAVKKVIDLWAQNKSVDEIAKTLIK